MSDIWQAKQYDYFIEERTQPATDLINRIRDKSFHQIVDLGCGTGNSTLLLKRYWPQANITGIDNSPNMLTKAQQSSAEISWQLADIASWQSNQKYDLIFSNAALQWLPNHEKLLPLLVNHLTDFGVLAIQIPKNFNAPTHKILVETIRGEKWSAKLSHLLRYENDNYPVHEPAVYYNLLAPLFRKLAIWQIDYLHVLSGENPILEWVKGTALRPFLAALQDEAEQQDFLQDYNVRITNYYPKQSDGTTLLSFNRLFIIAEK